MGYGEEQRPLGEEMRWEIGSVVALFGCGVTFSSPREKKTRVVPRKGIKTVQLFGEALLLAHKRFQELKCLPLKIIFISK